MNEVKNSSMQNTKIVYFSRFNCDENGHGGDKRAAQLHKILENLGTEFVSVYDIRAGYSKSIKNVFKNSSNPIHNLVAATPKPFVTYFKYHLWSSQTRDNVYFWHLMSRLFCSTLAGNKPRLILLDDPVFLAPVAKFAWKHDIPLVALCHNVETLSSTQVRRKQQTRLFSYEIDLLAKCSLVVTISREETVLMNNLGVNAWYFPYYPAPAIEARLLEIRRKRSGSVGKDFLLFGTVHNPPTMEGMKRLIAEISRYANTCGDRFLVAGFGTEGLKEFADSNTFTVLGSISNDQLDKLLVEVKTCLVYQENGSGALTKITEMLLAGVPVVANSHALRNYYNLPGVYEFRTWRELEKILCDGDIKCEPSTTPGILSPDPNELSVRVLALAKERPESI